MIVIAHIVPTAYLEMLPQLKTSRFHMILAHMVLQDPHYRAFYRNATDCYKLLDNSAFELGEALDDNALCRAILEVQPDEFVLPDSMFNTNKTKTRSENFIQRLGEAANIRLMGVPHGATLNEWIHSYGFFAQHPRVYSIGIGAAYCTPSSLGMSCGHYNGGRRSLLENLVHSRILNDRKPHDLLGFSHSGHFEIKALTQYPWLRSADTSSAYLLASMGIHIQIGKPYQKPAKKDFFFDPFAEQTSILLQDNMEVFDDAARSHS